MMMRIGKVSLLLGVWITISIGAAACGDDEDSSSQGADATDTASDASVEPIADGAKGETQSERGPVGNPFDGALYAAAGGALITPNDENHPCTLFLGGTGSNRKAEGFHTELEARAVLLAEDKVHVVIVSVDLVGWLASDVDVLKARLAEEGVDPRNVIVSSTHTHNAPDTVGIWGEDEFTSGRCPEYADFLVDTITDLVLGLRQEMRPVAMHLAEGKFDVPGSNVSNLCVDFRLPRVTNDHLSVLQLVALDKDAGDPTETIATLVNWHVHPEAMIKTRLVSADMSHWVRRGVEEALGGTAIYLSGTIGGLQTIMHVEVPERSEAGEPVLDAQGAPSLIVDEGEVKARSAGYVVAERALAALEEATVQSGHLHLDISRVELPFENLMMIIAFRIGLLPPTDTWITDDPERCGHYGCAPIDVHHLALGDFHLVTLPGELFPETSVGRVESSEDFGSDEEGDWGVQVFPAMTGYREALDEGAVLFELGLSNHEIGYIVPASDAVMNNHPAYYEEYFCVSFKAEALLREAITGLLTMDGAPVGASR